MKPMVIDWFTRASLEGGLLCLLVFIVGRFFPKLTPTTKAWLWRIVFLKFAISLVPMEPIRLEILPTPVSPVRHHGYQNPLPKPTSQGNTTAPTGEPDSAGAPIDIVTTLWVLGFLFISFRAAGTLWNFRRMIVRARPVLGEPERRILNGLTNRFDLRTTPALYFSEEVDTPMVIGGLCPKIVIPEPLLQSFDSEELSLVLAHELAHLKRGDLWFQTLASLIQAIFFYHPLIWVASRELQVAQESATDQLALNLTRASRKRYAQMLVSSTLNHSFPLPQPIGVLTMYGTYHSLQERIKSMKNPNLKNSPVMSSVTVALAGIVFVTLPAYRIARKQSGQEGPETLNNAKQLCLALHMYALDYDSSLPYSPKAPVYQSVTDPYLKNYSAWKSKNPNGGDLLFAANLAGALFDKIDQPQETPLVYDEKAWPDGRRVVGYLDGHAQFINAEKWKKTKRLLGKYQPHPVRTSKVP
jgi:beta-lactamase regulating signal transducer with metallopeptidase domain